MAINLTPLNPQSSNDDSQLSNLPGFELNGFLDNNSKIELFILTPPNNSIITKNYNYNNFTTLTSQNQSGPSPSSQDVIEISDIIIDPYKDFLKETEADETVEFGTFTMVYNFYNNIIGNNLQHLYISEISPDRTEIRLESLDLDSLSLESQTEAFVNKKENTNHFIEFHLNLGDNVFIPAVNIKLNDEDSNNPSILIKLKSPLNSNIKINTNLWVVELLEEQKAYSLEIIPESINVVDTTSIKGPNFNIEVNNEINNSTLPLSYLDLIATNSTSSQNQLDNLLKEKSLNINIDYTDFNSFVHFSSAKTRIENFYYKVKLIESYSTSLTTLNNTSTSTNISSSKSNLEGKINNIISNFDGYDRYLFYNTGSYSYPKTTTQKPYILASSNSPSVLDWLGNGDENSPNFGGLLASASLFDINNRNQLLKSIPEYLRDDPSNQQYELFVDMVAQYYDSIWIYLKDITNKYDNDNRLNFGISKDLVADAIRDFGIKLYQNNFSNDDLYTAFLGLTPDGSLFPYPNMTGSLPTPTGFEYVDTLISASNDILPQDDVNKSLYKRIYHNLPYLINSKGTIPGLRALITSYGIPDTILRINEYGGKDKININDWDHWQNEFNYAFNTSGSNFISSSWQLNSDWHSTANVPETLMFRFKTNGLPTSGSYFYSQSLWHGNGSSDTSIVLEYTGSGYTSGSYNGSVKDPYYQYANLIFHPDNSSPSTTASVYLPFFDGEWWSVMVRWDGASNWDLYSGNNLYGNGNNDTRIGFFASSSVNGNKIPWINTDTSYFPISFSVSSPSGYDIVTYDDTAIYDGTSGASASYSPFSGSYQEIRYYATGINENVFKDYVMNPYSIEGNTINSSPNELAFRASIGGELYTGSNSIHPKVTGSWTPTQSFSTGLSSFYYDNTPNFISNKEYFSVDQPVAGIKNVIGDKIRIENNSFPGGFPTASVLSPYKSILQQTNASQSYTPNINYLEVAFSPQNQINEDIMSQLGFFNIGDYIGDPRLRSSSADSYPDLDKLRDDYFQKYLKNYNLKDFVRLIKFFDNSLFKMIKNFIPARTSLASGLVIKQHLLERDKYPTPQLHTNTTIAKYAKSGSIIYNQPIKQQNLLVSGAILPQSRDFNQGTIVKVGGGTGGSFEPFNNLNTSPYGVSGSGPTNRYFLTQSWNETINPPSSHSIVRTISNQDEFYDGEFSGSNITVTTQSLADPYPILLTDLQYSPTIFSNLNFGLDIFSSFTQGIFLNPSLVPNQGEILIQAPFLSVVYPFPTSKGETITSSPYMKIHKDDCNLDNQTVPLQNCTSLRVQRKGLEIYDEYRVKNRTEFQSYFLFELENANVSAYIDFGSGRYSEVKDYTVVASGSSLLDPFGTEFVGVQFGIKPIDTLGYFDGPNGLYKLENQTNIPIHISASVDFGAGTGTCFVQINRNPIAFGANVGIGGTTIASNSGTGGSTVLVDAIITGSIDDFFNIQVSRTAGTATFSTCRLSVTQSVEPSSSLCLDVFLDPYVDEPNYYNSDFNPLMNNVMENRKNTIYQDVDYSLGVKPVNFDFLISGSAEKFPIPDSHYTQKSSVIPRYEGAKLNSQFLNKWTEGDTGMEAKLPSVSQLETKLVYADWIGGYPPEHMNASGVHVQYIINEDGTIKIPNTSEDALEDVQQTFMANRNLEINSNTIGAGEPSPQRKIIGGGYRINPVLYTQSGSVPNAKYPSSISLTDRVASSGSATSDIQANGNIWGYGDDFLKMSAKQRLLLLPSTVGSSFISSGTFNSLAYGKYTVTNDMIDDNITLNIILSNLEIILYLGGNWGAPSTYNLEFMLKKNNDTIETINYTLNSNDFTGGGDYIYYTLAPIFFNLPPNGISVGDEISIEILNTLTSGDIPPPIGFRNTGQYTFAQTPIPTTPINVGVNDIWGYPNKILYPNIITSSADVSSSLALHYGDPNVQQEDIANSGFNKIALPWSIEIGDEFRFEGVEANTYMVTKAFGPNEGSGSRVTPTGSIEVHFNGDLTVNASLTSFNLDHFLIRRYVPDASQIIIEGFKPTDSVGPYIIKPEYITSKLNKGIDDYILDLTNKGLI